MSQHEERVESVVFVPYITVNKDGTTDIDWNNSFVGCLDKDGNEVHEVRYVPTWGLLKLDVVHADHCLHVAGCQNTTMCPA